MKRCLKDLRLEALLNCIFIHILHRIFAGIGLARSINNLSDYSFYQSSPATITVNLLLFIDVIVGTCLNYQTLQKNHVKLPDSDG